MSYTISNRAFDAAFVFKAYTAIGIAIEVLDEVDDPIRHSAAFEATPDITSFHRIKGAFEVYEEQL